MANSQKQVHGVFILRILNVCILSVISRTLEKIYENIFGAKIIN